MFRKIFLTLLFAAVLTSAFGKVSKQKADSIARLLNQKEIVCDKACPLFDSEQSDTGLVNTIFIDVLAVIGTAWLYNNYKKKYIFACGAAVIMIVTGSLLYKNGTRQCVEYNKSSCEIVSNNNTEFITTDTNNTK